MENHQANEVETGTPVDRLGRKAGLQTRPGLADDPQAPETPQIVLVGYRQAMPVMCNVFDIMSVVELARRLRVTDPKCRMVGSFFADKGHYCATRLRTSAYSYSN